MRSLVKNLFVVLALIAGVDRAAAGAVSLTWNSSTNSAVDGYKIYYGTTSQTYFTNVVAGNVTNITISGLTEGTTYYFAATSYDAAGDESGYSDEVMYTATNQIVASAATLAPAVSSVAGQFSFTVSGAAGSQYVVQASTDLINWITLGTNVSPFTMVDSNAAAYPHRYYRAYAP